MPFILNLTSQKYANFVKPKMITWKLNNKKLELLEMSAFQNAPSKDFLKSWIM